MKTPTINLILVAIVFGLFGCSGSGPSAAIDQLQVAIQNKDMQGVQKYVDLNEFAVQVYSKQMVNSPFGDQAIRMAQDIVRKWVETGEIEKDENNAFLTALGRLKMIGADIKDLKIHNITVEGKISSAELQLPLPRYNTSIVRGAKFRDTENGWQLFAITDLDKLGEEIVQLEKKYTNQQNAEIASYGIKVKKIKSWQVGISGMKDIVLEVVTAKPIQAFKGRFYVQGYTTDFEHFKIKTAKQLDPKTWLLEMDNQFYIVGGSYEKKQVSVVIDEITKEDGTKLSRRKMWEKEVL